MATKKNQLAQTLLQFYDQPVAKVSTELLFSIFAVIFFAIFAIRPTLLTMSDLLKEISDKESLDQKLTQKIASLSSVQSQYLGAEERIAVLNKALPSSPEIDSALILIEKVASESKIAIISAEAKEVPKVDPPDTDFTKKVRLSKPILFTVTGAYPDIAKFVEGIRLLQREIVVESVSFSLSDSVGKKRLTANVVVSLQYFGVDTLGTGAAGIPIPAKPVTK